MLVASRKGLMYTFVALAILMVIGAVFFSQSRRTEQESASAAADRVITLNNFIHNFEKDSERAAYISGFRTFIAMEQRVTSDGNFFSDVPSSFREAFLNGTINDTSYVILESATFNEYIGRVHDDAIQQGILFNATVTNVSLWQVDPWNVLVNYTVAMDVSDSRGTSRWITTRTFTGRIPILDLRDPMFTALTYGRVQRVIRVSNVSVFVNDVNDANDTSGLTLHFNNSWYRASGRGPSLLMRFSGNFSDSPYGIESLVDTDDITTQNLPVNAKASVVDYLYFQNSLADLCSIQNLPSKIKLDTNHSSIYQIQGKLDYSACT